MANDHVMTLDKQLANLEVTVANGFQEQRRVLDEHTRRFDRLEDRISALDSKLDVVAESVRGEVTTIRELVTGFMGEMRRTTDSIRKEHEADGRLTRLALSDQVVRIRKLEAARQRPNTGHRKRRRFLEGCCSKKVQGLAAKARNVASDQCSCWLIRVGPPSVARLPSIRWSSPSRFAKVVRVCRYFLFSRGEDTKRWVCAVAKRDAEQAFLITVYPTDAIKEGTEIWPK